MCQPVLYFIRDPETGSMEQLIDFSAEHIDAAVDRGCEFMAIGPSGELISVPYTTVLEGCSQAASPIELIGPAHVAVRMQAVIEVFDALDSLLCDAPETASAQTAGTFRAAARAVEAPVSRFREKLAALKELAQAGGEAE